MTHEEAQVLIPPYASGRLTEDELRGLQAHLTGCETCSDLATGIGEIVSALQEGGERMLDSHPEESVLREHALGQSGGASEAIDRHLATCATCQLEVSTWTGRGAGAGSSRASGERQERSGSRLTAGGLLAAGLVLGFGAALLWTGRASRIANRGPAGVWSGRVNLHVLAAPTRDGEVVPRFSLNRDQTATILHIPDALPDPVAENERFRILIRRADGATVHESVQARSDMERDFERWGVMPLFVPAQALTPGRYDLLIARDGAQPETVLRMPFDIVPDE